MTAFPLILGSSFTLFFLSTDFFPVRVMLTNFYRNLAQLNLGPDQVWASEDLFLLSLFMKFIEYFVLSICTSNFSNSVYGW
ncbi:hypothetical protein BO99DRAFT_404852 [Aspergillus violaceofuscus CBS 115571]|uniref:Uncharacterized protein n=1 Tax=Aspergillus violaceofuscus (strain CBS 115571) TaxID=1450538 RepID=A0A2V5H458_ASPV1|nr:hypothetical protein BO99DRAFT_404852 [Aspergillus violaceofuscus CBS 115571]